MPAAKRAVTLNLGMQTVTMAVFEASDHSGLVLKSFARSELAPDPATDASRPGQLGIAVGELRSRLQIAGSDCAMAIPSQGVFTRFVKIPKVEPEQVGQMLFFEAQQNVPYPIEEVSWCYQVLPEHEEDKLGAIILATKLEELEATVNAVRGAGFLPLSIETSPTALYNALRYNYPDLAGCTLLIDIGARATNLIFSEGNRLFVRTLPVGGNSITIALQKKFESRSLAAVEEAKVREAFIPPPGNHETQGEEAAEMGKLARTVMTRIHNEVTRSITFYRTNQQGSAPMRVLLAGGGVSLPYTLEFFNEKLSLPIEFFNPLRRVVSASSVDAGAAQAHAHALGECVGMATRLLLGDCPLEINMRSRRLEAEAREKKRRPYLVAAVLILAGILAATCVHYKRAADRLAALNATLDVKLAELQSFKQQMDQSAAARKRLFDEAADAAASPMLRSAWAGVIDELSSRMPPRNIWITRLSPVAGDKILEPGKGQAAESVGGENTDKESGPAVTAIAVNGLYLDNESGPAVVDEFVENLNASEIFRISPENKTDIVKLRAAQTGETWAYEYQLTLPLRRPIPL